MVRMQTGALYDRVSSLEQSVVGVSLESQVASLRAYA